MVTTRDSGDSDDTSSSDSDSSSDDSGSLNDRDTPDVNDGELIGTAPAPGTEDGPDTLPGSDTGFADSGEDDSPDATIVFDDDATDDGTVSADDVKGTVTDPQEQEAVQDFAAREVQREKRRQQRFEQEQRLAESGQADINTLRGPRRISKADSTRLNRRNIFTKRQQSTTNELLAQGSRDVRSDTGGSRNINLVSGNSRRSSSILDGGRSRSLLPLSEDEREAIRNKENEVLAEARRQKALAQERFSKGDLDAAAVRGARAGLFAFGAPVGTAKNLISDSEFATGTAKSGINVLNQVDQEIRSIPEEQRNEISIKPLGETQQSIVQGIKQSVVEEPVLTAASLAGETVLEFGAGKGAQFAVRQGRRGLARLNPKFRRVQTADSGAESIDIDSLTERDDVNRIELVQPGGASQVDEAAAKAEGFGTEAAEGAFSKSITDQFQDARRLAEQDSITITSAQNDLTDTGLSKFFKGEDTELRSPDTIEEAREIASQGDNTGDPREALFFASPSTKSGNPVARKSRLGTQETRGISGLGLPETSSNPQILIDTEADLKNIFDNDEIGDLARKAADGDEQAAQQLLQSDEFQRLQFEQDSSFTPIGFDSPESELTTNAPVLRDQGRIAITDVDGNVVDVRRVSAVDPDSPDADLDQATKEALQDADSADELDDIIEGSDDLVSSSRKDRPVFSPSKATGQAAGFGSAQLSKLSDAQSVPESEAPSSFPASESPGASATAEDIASAGSISSPDSEPGSGSAASFGSDTPSSPSDPTSPTSPSSPGSPTGPNDPTSPGTGSPGTGSPGSGSPGGGSGGSPGSEPPSTGTPRRPDEDSSGGRQTFDVQIGREGNEVFTELEDLTRSEAQELVRKGVFETAAASTKITESSSGSPVSPEEIGIERGLLESRTDPGSYVEPRDERMSSPKELEDITEEIKEQKQGVGQPNGNPFSQRSTTSQGRKDFTPGQQEDFTPPGLQETNVESLAEQFEDISVEFDNPLGRNK